MDDEDYKDDKMIELLKALLHESIALCYKNDFSLIRRERMERACVSRIFFYMQELINSDNRFLNLQSYNLDCEYNKNGSRPKTTRTQPNGSFPDIILHHREDNPEKDNLLVIEFKMSRPNFDTKDEDKLKDFTDNDPEYNVYSFKLGVAVILCEKSVKFKYFQNGIEVLEDEKSFTSF
ncbi:MAG: hypothetical protein LBM87_01060 [Ruminococcus sp.]|jgi:hypothetical protein|nr:hypothetical protein [Ruminococcus sp.]